jgi:hypothetical protein
MIYNVIVKASQTKTSYNVDVELDLGKDLEDWENMSDEEKETEITHYIQDLPEQPYWVVDKFEVND